MNELPIAELPVTELPDGSGCFTATILSHEEAMALPPGERPMNHRLPGDLYHGIWQAVGAASLCWIPAPEGRFDMPAAEKVAMGMCCAVAAELDKYRAAIEALLAAAPTGADLLALSEEPEIHQIARLLDAVRTHAATLIRTGSTADATPPHPAAPVTPPPPPPAA